MSEPRATVSDADDLEPSMARGDRLEAIVLGHDRLELNAKGNCLDLYLLTAEIESTLLTL